MAGKAKWYSFSSMYDGRKIRDLRTRHRFDGDGMHDPMTQAQLARKVGVTTLTIYRAEGGLSCSPDLLLSIAQALKVDWRTLLRGPGNGDTQMLLRGLDADHYSTLEIEMSEEDILDDIRRDEIGMQPQLRWYAYKAALYEIRFGKAYKGLLKVPRLIAEQERERAENDWRALAPKKKKK